MWYYITAFVMWAVESLEELVGEKHAPWVFCLLIAIFFGLSGYLIAMWLGIGE